MKVAISQSNYIPWKGYFDMIDQADIFVLYDDMQYTRRDWRNRNKIKTAQGLQWLTIPVDVKGKYLQKINETHISDSSWAAKHLRGIELNYAKADQFDTWFPQIENWYEEAGRFTLLSDVNRFFISKICSVLCIDTELVDSRKFDIQGAKTEALISVLEQIEHATEYISGPAAKAYMDLAPFTAKDIDVKWMDYAGYPEYGQQRGAFEHGVSIFDVLLHAGADKKWIKTQ